MLTVRSTVQKWERPLKWKLLGLKVGRNFIFINTEQKWCITRFIVDFAVVSLESHTDNIVLRLPVHFLFTSFHVQTGVCCYMRI